jgi:DNA-binding transcriptional LysR family regulator
MSKLPLNLIYLKYFCDAVRQGSISASARENFVSQSAISQGICQLEKSLGKELITHQANRFKATQDGLIVFERAKRVFESVAELEKSLLVDEGIISGRIEFACMHSFALALLPKCLKTVKNEWPKLHVNFRLAHTDVIREWIKRDLVDFGIVLDNEDLSAYDCFEIYQGEYRLYISRKQIRNKDLPFILSEERVETNLLKKSYRKYQKKEINVLMEVSSWEVIANLTEAGLAIGFFPDYVALKRKKELIEFQSKYDPIPYKIYAIFSKSKKRDKNVEAFLELLRGCLQSPIG